MPAIVLPKDLTGTSPLNRITDEIVTLTTGRSVALAYGGFYTASLNIVVDATDQVLVPVIDYLVLAPYDEISEQTGKEAACVIQIVKTPFAGDYRVTYQAVGGDYATNVEALEQVLTDFNQSETVVNWNSIVNKPEGFETGPHLRDFRTEITGFEGLIGALQSLGSVLSGPSKGEIGAIIVNINSAINSAIAGVNVDLDGLQNQIDNLVLALPASSGYLQGTAATTTDINTGTDGSKFLSSANILALVRRIARSYNLSTAFVNDLDTTTEFLISGTFNLRSNGKGDSTVDNSTLPYIVETKRWSSENGGDRFVQHAYSPNSGVILKRHRYDGVLSLWTRIDKGVFGTSSLLNKASGPDISWDTPNDNAVPSVTGVKTLLEKSISSGHVLQSTEVGFINTITVPTAWITVNLSTAIPYLDLPNQVATWVISTTVSPINTNFALQIAFDFSGVKLFRLRTNVGPNFGDWTRTDDLNNVLSSWSIANKASLTDLSWLTPVENKATDPAFIKEFLLYNARWINPVGVISLWPGLSDSALPPSFKVCDGSLLSRTDYPQLFNVLETRYGFTTSSNFRLPDLRGVFIRGLDNRTPALGGRDPSHIRYEAEDIGLGTYQQDSIQNIYGEIWANRLMGDGPHGTEFASGPFQIGPNVGAVSSGGEIIFSGRKVIFNAALAVRTDTETRPKNVALHYIIKVDNRH
jgi:hypothetical protein